MNVNEMKKRFTHTFDTLGTFAEAELLLQADLETWFDEYGERLVFEKHFLRVNLVKVYWSKKTTRIERTADLVLRGDASSTPHLHADGKILCKGAVEFLVTWPNAKS